MSDPSTNDGQIFSRTPKFRFSIGFLLILSTVVAASGMSLNYYSKAIYAEDVDTAVGVFAIVAAMTPTVFLVVASWFLKAVSFFKKLRK